MPSQSRCLSVVLSLVAALSVAACSSVREKFTVNGSESIKISAGRDKALDFRFDEIVIKNWQMAKLVNALDERILYPSGITVYTTTIPSIAPLKNQRIDYRAHNVILREVLTAICKQSGWGYEQRADEDELRFIEPIFEGPPSERGWGVDTTYMFQSDQAIIDAIQKSGTPR